MRSNQDHQIISAFEQGMTIQELSEHFEKDEIAIKACLYQGSQLYRDRSKKEVDLKFTESEQERAKNAITRIMENSDDDYLVLRAAKYIRDDAEGRLDNPLKGLKNLNVTVIEFNAQLMRAKEGKQRSLKQANSSGPQIEDKSDKVIDVEEVKAA